MHAHFPGRNVLAAAVHAIHVAAARPPPPEVRCSEPPCGPHWHATDKLHGAHGAGGPLALPATAIQTEVDHFRLNYPQVRWKYRVYELPPPPDACGLASAG